MLKKAAIFAVVGAVLAGCATSSAPMKALPASHVDEVYAAAFASTIADKCRTIRYNEAQENREVIKIATQLSAAGYTKREVDAGLARATTDREMTIRILRFVNEREINVDSEASWCRVGRTERAKKTQIGKYLI